MNHTRRLTPLILTILSIAVFLIFWRATTPVAAQGEPSSLSLEVVPDAIELAPGEKTPVTVVLRNPSDRAVQEVSLSWIGDPALAVSGEAAAVEAVPANGEIAWVVTVAWEEQPRNSANVHFRLDYTWPSPAPASGEETASPGGAPRVLLASLQVAAPDLQPAEELAAIQIQSTLTTLNEQRPGRVNLLLQNKSSVPLTIRDVRAGGPAFVTLTPLDPGGVMRSAGTAAAPAVRPAEEEENLPHLELPLTLAPREMRNIPVSVEATDVVQPGKSLLLFEVDLTWESGGQLQRGTLAASHEVDVGVFGESQILTLLGIPAFFLLPGFLMLVAFRLLWTNVSVTKEKTFFLGAPSVQNPSADFWFVAITLSLVTALFYPLLSRLTLGVRRNYLQGYGLVDVFLLWFASIMIGWLFYALYYGAVRIRQEQQVRAERERQEAEAAAAAELARRLPAATDDPAETVRKLQRRELDLQRPPVYVAIEGSRHRLYRLQDEAVLDGNVWVAPRILIRNRDVLGDDSVQKLYAVLDGREGIGTFLALLPQLELGWEGNWPHAGPIEVAAESIEQEERSEVMVDFA